MTIFDPIRKKCVAATPEEQVRQGLVRYLHTHRGAPMSLIMLERSLKINNMHRRYDVVVYSSEGTPLLLAECKASGVALTNRVFEQAAIYNMALRTPYLLITNGTQTYCCRIDFGTGGIAFLDEIPRYDEMKRSAFGASQNM